MKVTLTSTPWYLVLATILTHWSLFFLLACFFFSQLLFFFHFDFLTGKTVCDPLQSTTPTQLSLQPSRSTKHGHEPILAPAMWRAPIGAPIQPTLQKLGGGLDQWCMEEHFWSCKPSLRNKMENNTTALKPHQLPPESDRFLPDRLLRSWFSAGQIHHHRQLPC